MSKINRRNYYRLLHVQHDAPAEVIKASYRTIMQKLKQHPDLGGDSENASLLNKAYATLMDETMRAAYDKKRALSRQPEHAQPPKARPQSRQHDRSSHNSRFGPAYCPFCQVNTPGKTLRGEVSAQCRVCESPLNSVKKVHHGGRKKRAVKRTTVQGDVHFLTTWPQRTAEHGEIENLSPMGVKFIYAGKLEPNSLIKIDSNGLQAVGRVVSCLRSSDRNTVRYYSIGVEFITLSYHESRGAFVRETA